MWRKNRKKAKKKNLKNKDVVFDQHVQYLHGSFNLFLLVATDPGTDLLFGDIAGDIVVPIPRADLKSKRSLILSMVEANRVEDSRACL